MMDEKGRALELAKWFEGITPLPPHERTLTMTSDDKRLIAMALRALIKRDEA
jgi:hypothetical protein